MNWQLNPNVLIQILNFLKNATSSDSLIQQQVQQQLPILNSLPDINNYLVYIFTRLGNEQPEQVRFMAGMFLKNNIYQNYSKIPMDVRDFIKREILLCVGDPSLHVRKSLSLLILNMLKKENVKEWPSLLKILIQYLDNQNLNIVEGAFNTLFLICEEFSKELDSDEAGRPLNILIPKFINFLSSPHENLRRYAITCLNQFLVDMPPALLVHMEKYLQGIFNLTNDPNPEIKRNVCQALVTLVEIRIDYIKPYLSNIIEYMLITSRDSNESIAIEACEFWPAIAKEHSAYDIVKIYLPKIVSLLLDNMVYSEMDMTLLYVNEDASEPDNPKDIKPIIYHSKIRSSSSLDTEEGNESDEEDNESDEVSQWNIRKCCALGLDYLSYMFRNELLFSLLPIIQNKLNESNWKVRESAILALGAIAEGCSSEMIQYLPNLIPYLFTFLNDSHPLIRNITCWTLSRYSEWIVSEPEVNKYLKPFIFFMLNLIHDSNKKVQEAACSAFATMEEKAQLRLIPYLDTIIKGLISAFPKYQAKNLIILYDAIGTLADSVGNSLNKPEFINILLPPLISKWNELNDDDKNLLPLLECLSPIVIALGVGFQSYAQPVFQRCLKLIEINLIKENQKNNFDNSNREFIVASLDLISALCEGLHTGIESLVSNSNLIHLIYECMKKNNLDILQSAFALCGDLAKNCIIYLKPVLNPFLEIIIQNLIPNFVPVCNNASWAIGEIAIKIGEDIQPFIPSILEKLISLINNGSLNSNLRENVSITIGRLSFVSPKTVAPYLEMFIQRWCSSISNLRDNQEKEITSEGLCKMIKLNPNAVIKHFGYVCKVIVSWENPPNNLKSNFYEIIYTFKNSVDSNTWDQYINAFPQNIVLYEKYPLQ